MDYTGPKSNSFDNINTIIFDFDYTLADSSKGIIESINYALKFLRFPGAPSQIIHRTVGLSLEDTFLNLVGHDYIAKREDFRKLFIKRADEVMADFTVLFEAVPQMIKLLKRKGISLAIYSTKFRYRIEAILKREKLLNLFDIIIGWEDVSKPKPDPEGLLVIIKKLKSRPLNSIYVGDHVLDAETAKRAGIPFIAVLTGVTSEKEFRYWPVYKILKSLVDLPNLIFNSKGNLEK